MFTRVKYEDLHETAINIWEVNSVWADAHRLAPLPGSIAGAVVNVFSLGG